MKDSARLRMQDRSGEAGMAAEEEVRDLDGALEPSGKVRREVARLGMLVLVSFCVERRVREG